MFRRTALSVPRGLCIARCVECGRQPVGWLVAVASTDSPIDARREIGQRGVRACGLLLEAALEPGDQRGELSCAIGGLNILNEIVTMVL